MPEVSATPEVTAALLALRDDDPALFALVVARIGLMRRDPAHPRAAGATFRSGDRSIHVVEIGTERISIGLVWTLVRDEIRIVAVETIG